MTTQPTLLDKWIQSEQGVKSRREDGLGDPHGATITPTSSLKPPQDITKNAKISVPRTKTVNHTPEVANSFQINDSMAKRLKELRRAYDVQRGIAESAKGREAYNAAILANYLKMRIQSLEEGGIE